MACSSHSPRVRGTMLLHCDITLPPEVIRYFFHPESCPLLAGSCTRYELQLSPGRKERKSAFQIRGVAHTTSTEFLRYPMDTSVYTVIIYSLFVIIMNYYSSCQSIEQMVTGSR